MEEEILFLCLCALLNSFSGGFFVRDYYMKQALSLAKLGGYLVSPNPKVGCVIVKDGKVVGKGYHSKCGGAHAEAIALAEAGRAAHNATLYVNLEPCCHYGRTPPCTEAIIRAGLSRVVYAMDDPNPLMQGKSAAILEKAGVAVQKDVCKKEAIWLNRAYIKHSLTGRPYVTYKMAMTIDGKSATSTGDSQWISGTESRDKVHFMRRQIGNIMIGGGTALKDNPRLTARSANVEIINLRIIIAGTEKIPREAQLLASSKFATLVFAAEKTRDAYRGLPDNVEVEFVVDNDGYIDMGDVLSNLGARGVNHVLCEGGASLGGNLLKQSFIDEVVVFLAPKIMGDDQGRGMFFGVQNDSALCAKELKLLAMKTTGKDIMLRYVLKEVVECSPVWSKLLER
jgi:diaminohydroxyphosphoribosylaminopyrimidine deaminase/5-amino-6-(5-phosphoribosylamino)uracil reductase